MPSVTPVTCVVITVETLASRNQGWQPVDVPLELGHVDHDATTVTLGEDLATADHPVDFALRLVQVLGGAGPRVETLFQLFVFTASHVSRSSVETRAGRGMCSLSRPIALDVVFT